MRMAERFLQSLLQALKTSGILADFTILRQGWMFYVAIRHTINGPFVLHFVRP